MIAEEKKMDRRSLGLGAPAVEDLWGREFGKLTVQYRFKHTTMGGNVSWKCHCVCSCGNSVDVYTNSLKSGSATHCGCSRKKRGRSPRKYLGTDSLVGERFGTVVVTKCYYDDIRKRGKSRLRWCETLCDCGRTGVCQSESLISKGENKTCGHFPCIKSHRGHGQITGYIWSKIRLSAKKRGLDFDITIEQAWDLLVEQGFRCALTGRPIEIGKVLLNDNYMKDGKDYASLDRRDSKKGYTLDNIQWVARIANFCKQAYDEDDFIKLCEDVVRTRNEKVSAARGRK